MTALLSLCESLDALVTDTCDDTINCCMLLIVKHFLVMLLGTRTIDRRMRDEMQSLYPKVFGKKVTNEV